MGLIKIKKDNFKQVALVSEKNTQRKTAAEPIEYVDVFEGNIRTFEGEQCI